MVVKPANLIDLKHLISQRPFAIYGLGGMGKRIIDFCKSNDIEINCYIDKNTNALQNEVVISPDKIGIQLKNYNILIASPIYFDEIKQNLLKLGFTDEQIISYKMFVPDELFWDDLEPNANWAAMRSRVIQMAKWITDDIKSVVDYGAGEMYVEKFLSSEVKYFPIDYIKRNDKIIVCDLNLMQYPNILCELSILSAVIEVIKHEKKLISHVCKSTSKKIIASYLPLDTFSDIEGRKISSYINHYTEKEFIELFESNGFALTDKQARESNSTEFLFLFEKL